MSESTLIFRRTAVAGMLIGLTLTIWTWARAASMSADGAHYMELAERSWRLGPLSGMDWYSGPGYPVAAGWLFGVCGDLDFAGRATSFLFGLGMLAGVGVLGWRLFGRAVAALAVGLLAVHTTFVRHAVMAETDVAYGCWLVWSIVGFWELKHATRHYLRAAWSVFAGLTLGFGYLTRPEAVPLGVLLVLWYLSRAAETNVVASGGRQPPDHQPADAGRSPKPQKLQGLYSLFARSSGRFCSLTSRIGWASLVCVLGLIVASPYLVKLREELGRWSLSGKERSIVLKFVPDKRNYEEVLKLGVTGAILHRPSNVVHWLPYHLHWGLPQFVKSLHPMILVLAMFGICRRRFVERPPGAVGLLVWVSVPFIVFFFLTFPGRRYFMQAMPQWTILAAVGTVELAGVVAGWRERVSLGIATPGAAAAARRAFAISVATPILLVAVSTWWGNREPLEQSRIAERTIGERILAMGGPGRRVLSFTIPAFYARAERVPLWGPMQGIVRCHGYGEPLTYDEFVEYVRRHRVEYAVLDHDLRKDCPEFLDRVRPEDFELVIDDIRDTRGPCLVYRYVGQRDSTPTLN